MKPVKIEITFLSNSQKQVDTQLGKYDLKNHCLYYQENREEPVNMIIDLKKHKLIRDSDSHYLEYQFLLNQKTNNSLTIKELAQTINIEIETTKLISSPDGLEVTYHLVDSNQKIEYKVIFEEVEK